MCPSERGKPRRSPHGLAAARPGCPSRTLAPHRIGVARSSVDRTRPTYVERAGLAFFHGSITLPSPTAKAILSAAPSGRLQTCATMMPPRDLRCICRSGDAPRTLTFPGGRGKALRSGTRIEGPGPNVVSLGQRVPGQAAKGRKAGPGGGNGPRLSFPFPEGTLTEAAEPAPRPDGTSFASLGRNSPRAGASSCATKSNGRTRLCT